MPRNARSLCKLCANRRAAAGYNREPFHGRAKVFVGRVRVPCGDERRGRPGQFLRDVERSRTGKEVVSNTESW